MTLRLLATMAVHRLGVETGLNVEGAKSLKLLRDVAEGRRLAVDQLKALSSTNVGLRLEWEVATSGPHVGFKLSLLAKRVGELAQSALRSDPASWVSVSSDEIWGGAADTVQLCCDVMAKNFLGGARGCPVSPEELASFAASESVAYLVFSGEPHWGRWLGGSTTDGCRRDMALSVLTRATHRGRQADRRLLVPRVANHAARANRGERSWMGPS